MTETTLNDLPPCPFCGGKDMSIKTSKLFCWTSCNKCSSNGPMDRTERQAMKRWSERHAQKDGQ